MIHALKIDHNYFDDVISGRKTFEVRENDRLYEVGDLLALNEHNAITEIYTGRSCLVKVDYILDDSAFCKEGYVVMSIKPCYVSIHDGYDIHLNRNVYTVPVIQNTEG